MYLIKFILADTPNTPVFCLLNYIPVRLLLVSELPNMINNYTIVIPRAKCEINSTKEAKNSVTSCLMPLTTEVYFTTCQDNWPTSKCVSFSFFFLNPSPYFHKASIWTDNNCLIFTLSCIYFFHLFILFKSLLFERLYMFGTMA